MKFVVFQYFVFLFLLLCAELVVAVTTLVYREHFLTGLENRLMNRFKDDYGRDAIFTQAVEQAQFTVSVSPAPLWLRAFIWSPTLYHTGRSRVVAIQTELRGTPLFHGRLSGVPQTHVLYSEVCKCNLNNFNSIFCFPAPLFILSALGFLHFQCKLPITKCVSCI